MKALALLLISAFFFGCLANKIADIDTDPTNITEEFVGKVPDDFTWSSIIQKEINVTFNRNNQLSGELNNTVVELYNDDNVLIDALTIHDGIAKFNVRIPASSKKLKLVTLANICMKEFNISQSDVAFELSNIKSAIFAKTDNDKDGLYDQFDAEPDNPDVTIRIERNIGNELLKGAMKEPASVFSYAIFEDLWPSKGDYDFNDMVVKTTFSWVRGKSNYIQEITGVCKIEWIGAGMGIGLGYELFEANGTTVTYKNDVILQASGEAVKDVSVTNGIILFQKIQEAKKELIFSVSLKDKEIKDFVFIPYLFRTDNYKHQVRPFGAPPTQSQDMSMFNTKNDESPVEWIYAVGTKFKYPLAGKDAFYRTSQNHPWAIEFMAKSFKPSSEKKSIIELYPYFKAWAESGGKNHPDWYDYPNE